MKKTLLLLSLLFAPMLNGCAQKQLGNQVNGCSDTMSCACAKGEINSMACQAHDKSAEKFLDYADLRLRDAACHAELADWNYLTDINPEKEKLATEANVALKKTQSEVLRESLGIANARTDDEKRKLEKIRTAATMPAPADADKRAELASINAKLVGFYGANTGNVNGEKLPVGKLSDILAYQRDPKLLERAWTAWRENFKGLDADYERMIALGNEGAKESGFDNLKDLWLGGYDTDPAAFSADIDKLYAELKPLYDNLHCYVRSKLAKQYGKDVIDTSGPIPAHLLGNMWAQEWSNIYPLVAPYPEEKIFDVTDRIVKQNLTPLQMTQIAEKFYMSLGLKHLPKSFWEKSMFEKPDNREVVCHASAWDIDTKGDVRIKMCISPTAEDLEVIHHELGHVYYYLYYNHLPFIYQSGANDGFHEAIGDTLTLSMTPEYFKAIALLDGDAAFNEKQHLNHLMKSALDKVAFLPFGLVIDRWRHDVFSGKVQRKDYNAHWWKLREELQGVKAPNDRTGYFDPAAKYHVNSNTPYLRYFLARILQFQFHKALCEAAGHKGSLSTCSIYGNKEAGKKLIALLEKGSSRPWQKTLEELTGSPRMSAEAMLEFYAPLSAFLEKENKGMRCSQ